MTLVTFTPFLARAWAMGYTTAVPTPPPTHTACPLSSSVVGLPSGPAMSVMASPTVRAVRS